MKEGGIIMDLKDTAEKLIQGDVKGVISNVSKQLERTIGLVGIIIISLSAMLGSGLFVLPSFAIPIMLMHLFERHHTSHNCVSSQ